MPRERGGEDEQRQRHPAPTLVQRRAGDASAAGERADEADSEEQDVEPGRPAVKECVSERAECYGDTEQCDSEATFPTHPVGNADSRL